MNKALETLKDGGYTFVAVKGDEIRTSTLRGVAPIIKLIDTEPQFLCGASVADKVIGKASAMLLYAYGVKEIYTPLISEKALEYSENKKIKIAYNEKTDHIINRDKTDICPMEKCVLNTNDEKEAEMLIRNKIKELIYKI